MQQMSTVDADFSWSVHCARALHGSIIHARTHVVVSRLCDDSQLRRAVSLVEMNCRSEYCPLPHQRGLIACSMLRQAAKKLAVDLSCELPCWRQWAELCLFSRTATAAVTFLSVTLAHVMRMFACNA